MLYFSKGTAGIRGEKIHFYLSFLMQIFFYRWSFVLKKKIEMSITVVNFFLQIITPLCSELFISLFSGNNRIIYGLLFSTDSRRSAHMKVFP